VALEVQVEWGEWEGMGMGVVTIIKLQNCNPILVAEQTQAMP